MPPTKEDETKSSQLPTFHPSDFVGCTFLLDPQEDGQRFHACIVQVVEDDDAQLYDSNADWFKFAVPSTMTRMRRFSATMRSSISSSSRMMMGPSCGKFRCIITHEGPLKLSDPSYKDSKYNVMIKWENGQVTSEPLTILAADNPVTCTIYAKENDLLDLDDWKRFIGIAR